jgi:hypothetical protein
MSHDDALTEIARTPHQWRDDVYAAFCTAMARVDVGAAVPVATSSPEA